MKTIALVLLSVFCLSSFGEVREWTSPERVVKATLSMQEKALNFHQSINSSNVKDKVLLLADACKIFADEVENGISYEEALKEFEKFSGIYHHVDRVVCNAFNFNFAVMLRWRGVEWAWEPVSWNMYGTVP